MAYVKYADLPKKLNKKKIVVYNEFKTKISK